MRALALALLGLAACASTTADEIAPDDPAPNEPAPGAKRPNGKPAPVRDADEPPPAAGDGPAFVSRVVSFTPGRCGGFGGAEMPDIVLGPPRGAGDTKGSLDVVSLGNGGEIVLGFEPFAIVDGDGPDFVVFENAFFPAGDRDKPYAEPAEVSVSEDGETWVPFPCTSTAAPYGACAGWRPVYASPESAVSPASPEAGGDPFDLGAIGVARARFVRIKDKTAQRCTSQGPDTNGFDLDAVAAIHTSR